MYKAIVFKRFFMVAQKENFGETVLQPNIKLYGLMTVPAVCSTQPNDVCLLNGSFGGLVSFWHINIKTGLLPKRLLRLVHSTDPSEEFFH